MGMLTPDGRWPRAFEIVGDGSEVRGPAGHVVERLTWREARGGAPSLAAFADLRELRVEGADGADLGALRSESIRSLAVIEATHSPLTFIAHLPALSDLELLWIGAGCAMPDGLPSGLERLSVMVESSAPDDVVGRLLDAVDWPTLQALRHFELVVQAGPSVVADLGFVAALPALESINLEGVEHGGPGPSPLAPPFDGLPQGLRSLQAHATEAPGAPWSDEYDAAVVQWDRAAAARLGLRIDESDPDGPVESGALRVFWQPTRPPGSLDDPGGSWSLLAPDERDPVWSTYGSLDVAQPPLIADAPFDEAAAAERAEAAVRSVDAALADRIEWDPEASGTGLAAERRADLERAFEILGITPPASPSGDH